MAMVLSHRANRRPTEVSLAGEEGQKTLDHLSVVEEKNERDEEEEKAESLVIEEGEPKTIAARLSHAPRE